MNAYSDEAEFCADCGAEWLQRWGVRALFALTAVLAGCWFGGVTNLAFRDAAHVHLGLLIGARLMGGPSYLGWLAVALGTVEVGCVLFALR